MKVLVSFVTIIALLVLCEANSFRKKRSPQEGGYVEYTQREEAKQVDDVLNERAQSSHEFHYLQDGDVTFTCVTRNNREGEPVNENTKLKNLKTVFAIANWMEDTKSPNFYFQNLSDAYLKKGEYNIILVHADPLMNYPEEVSASYTEPIGSVIGDLIIRFNRQNKLSLSNVHLVGHGLGSHIAGAAGRYVTALTGNHVGRISALEVSSKGFEGAEVYQKLTKSDAKMVDVYHTAAGQIGLNESLGSADFWPNGGLAPQPGCPLYPEGDHFTGLAEVAYCSYQKSVWYFIYTINSKVNARKCDSYENYLNRECKYHSVATFGDNYEGTHTGNFYLFLFCSKRGRCASLY